MRNDDSKVTLYYSVLTLAMPKTIQKAKIACLDFSLQKAKMHLGIQVVIEQPDKLEAIRDRYDIWILLVKSIKYYV